MEANEPRCKPWKITYCLSPISLICKMGIKCLLYKTVGRNRVQRGEKRVKTSVYLLAWFMANHKHSVNGNEYYCYFQIFCEESLGSRGSCTVQSLSSRGCGDRDARHREWKSQLHSCPVRTPVLPSSSALIKPNRLVAGRLGAYLIWKVLEEARSVPK